MTGLPDTLISDYELRDTEHDDERSVSPLQTERVDSDHHIAATAAGICSNRFVSFIYYNISTLCEFTRA